jgi:hypothetical protein
MNSYFKKHDPLKFSIFGNEIGTLISALNSGRTAGAGTVSITASRRGYRITVSGRTFAKGKTPQELHASFSKAIDRVVNGHQ